MTEKIMQIKPYPLGAHCEGEGIRFAFVSEKESCGILIFNRETGEQIEQIPFDTKHKIGNVWCAFLAKYKPEEISYQFYEEDLKEQYDGDGRKVVPDQNAALFVGAHVYGSARDAGELKAGFVTEAFDWQNDKNPRIPYEDSLCYLLHVRGFTKHASSQVEHGGTFRGIVEKLPYLQEIGVTTVELQPAYEFAEIPSKEERMKEIPYPVKEGDLASFGAPKLNYWGYKKGYYYTPKAAYAVKDAVAEFKEMVRAFHQNGMEIVMQFYFPKEVPALEIPEILRYWVMEYHVDGFHLMGENLPIELYAADPVLAQTKLWYYDFNADVIYKRSEYPAYRNLAAYNDDYLYTMRKFLKGDEDMVKAVQYQMRRIPEKKGRIHYMSNYYGMTLMDMVSYDRKHNEENGEDNRDGNDYNYSWNCGEEGDSEKEDIKALRLQQLKNALCMIMFSQSTPLIFMGDEFGNSQKGNNNPYCQDNDTTWLDWNDIKRNAEIHSFWKRLVELRRKYPVLHPADETKMTDSLACGYPDLSYHGESAWNAETKPYSRWMGIMLCGKYAKAQNAECDFLYIAMNMHWENHDFGLPKLPKGMAWKECIATMATNGSIEDSSVGNCDAKLHNPENHRTIPARSIAVFCSVSAE